MNRFISFVIISTFFCAGFSQHQEQNYFPVDDPLVQEKLEQWQDIKFGLLMHWGAYSQWGIVESWSICAEDEGWCRRKTDNYTDYKKEYEGLKKTFNPTDFNPEKWAKAAKDAGMKYMVFTTKHHDGFCMFDSKYTDYKITDSECPFSANPKANITKEIFDAFRDQNLWIGAYFSKPDWHHENYWWPNFATPDRNVNYNIKSYPERWEKYVRFTHNQIDELMSNYGSIDILWLDGGWVQPMSDDEVRKALNSSSYKFTRIQSQDIRMDEIAAKARKKQPGLIVVDRAVEGKNQNYLTPENRVPAKTLPYPWESCIIAGGGWSWVPNPKFKSANETIHMLIDIVIKGGNLLLNIAPGPHGDWHPDAYKLLKEVGLWMKINGDAIYQSKPLEPYKEGKMCVNQMDDGSVNLFYLADPKEKQIPKRIFFSSIRPEKKADIHLLGTNIQLKWKYNGTGFYIEVPTSLRKDPPCQHAWVFNISGIE